MAPSSLKTLIRTRPFAEAAWLEATDAHLHLRIGNAPPLLDRATSLAALSAFHARIVDFGVGYCETWSRREAIYIETEITFCNASGWHSRIPCVVVGRSQRGLLQDLRFHLDPSPLPPI